MWVWMIFYFEKWPDFLCYFFVTLALNFNPAGKMSKKQTSLKSVFENEPNGSATHPSSNWLNSACQCKKKMNRWRWQTTAALKVFETTTLSAFWIKLVAENLNIGTTAMKSAFQHHHSTVQRPLIQPWSHTGDTSGWLQPAPFGAIWGSVSWLTGMDQDLNQQPLIHWTTCSPKYLYCLCKIWKKQLSCTFFYYNFSL